MRSVPRSDLHWLAYRYVSGELSAEEIADFEGRLAHDQSAREAVALAVEVIDAVAMAGPLAPEVLPMLRRRLVRPLLAAAAAAACVALTVWYFAPGRSAVRALPGRGAAQILALNWSSLHDGSEAGPNPLVDGLAWLDDPGSPADSDAVMAAGALDASDVALPVWLVEAASLRDGAGSRGSEIKEN